MTPIITIVVCSFMIIVFFPSPQAVFSGMTISTCIWGYVSDNFGRKMVTVFHVLIFRTSYIFELF